jgi:hypothetical protein
MPIRLQNAMRTRCGSAIRRRILLPSRRSFCISGAAIVRPLLVAIPAMGGFYVAFARGRFRRVIL